MSKKIILIFIAIIVIGIATYLIYPVFNVKEANEASPLQEINGENAEEINVKIISQGEFVASAHEVKGKALIIKEDNKKILRFEDFETINGPDLRIYLSNDLDVDDSIDLGPIKATKGNVNYEIDNSIDTLKYDKVLVWCRAFKVLFSYSDLE